MHNTYKIRLLCVRREHPSYVEQLDSLAAYNESLMRQPISGANTMKKLSLHHDIRRHGRAHRYRGRFHERIVDDVERMRFVRNDLLRYKPKMGHGTSADYSQPPKGGGDTRRLAGNTNLR